MAIIMISSLSHSGRSRLAEQLGRKTGWRVVSREDLLDQATAAGIRTGRLELSIIRAPGASERLAREKVLYLAFVTTSLCELAAEGNLIYHGRAGHLLLPGLTQRLRVGLTLPMEARVRDAMESLNLSEEKAMAYLYQLDEDVERWFHKVHNADIHDPGQFDFSVNLENVGMGNAASLICRMAEMPDFQPTPASEKLLGDLHLAARARLKLGLDPRTAELEPEVRADGGVATVIYPPRQEERAEHIPEVLRDLEELKEIRCTAAETNILWVQEDFDPDSDNFNNINHLAQRWGAAVELLRYIPLSSQPMGTDPDVPFSAQPNRAAKNGGVEDDGPEPPADEAGLIQTSEKLIVLGRFGGLRTVRGSHDRILDAARTEANYSLVVIGDMYLSKDHAVRTRQTRELNLAIRDRLKAPVIMADDLRSRFMFGPREGAKLVLFAAMTLLTYYLVFHYQTGVMDWLAGTLHQKWKIISAVSAALFVPLAAYLYSSVTGLFLKLINLD